MNQLRVHSNERTTRIEFIRRLLRRDRASNPHTFYPLDPSTNQNKLVAHPEKDYRDKWDGAWLR